MSDRVLSQLSLAARALDQMVAPLTMDEITARSAVDERLSLQHIQRPDAPPVDVGDTDASPPARRRGLLLIPAAAVLVLTGIVGLVARDPQPTTTPAATGDEIVATTTTADFSTTTIDPLSDLDLPPGGMPTDIVQRFTSSLGAFGQIWVYDSTSTDQIYFVRRGTSGASHGYFDRSTYESGQGWGLDSTPETDLLWGLTPPAFPVTVSFGNTSVSSDANGLWYTPAPKDLPSFTITTPTETINVDLVTSNGTPQTTTVAISAEAPDIAKGTIFGLAPMNTASPEDAVALLRPWVGEVTWDTNWQPMPEEFACTGNDLYRTIWWGDLRMTFETTPIGTLLTAWSVGAAEGLAPLGPLPSTTSPATGIETAEGVRTGLTVSEVLGIFPGVTYDNNSQSIQVVSSTGLATMLHFDTSHQLVGFGSSRNDCGSG